MGTGIAIDQTGIRMIQARTGRGDVSVTGAGYFPFDEPYENWQQGFMHYQDSYDLPSGTGYIGVSGRHLSLRNVTLPARNQRELSKLVEKEVQQFAGSHQQDELTHAFQRLPSSDDDPNEITVLVGILRSEWIMQASELLKRHNLQLDGCIPDAVSVFQAYTSCTPPDHAPDETIMLAWLGYNSIDLCLVHNQQFFAARSTRGGIATILEAAPSGDKRNLFQQLIGRPKVSSGDLSEVDTDRLIEQSMPKLSLRLSTAYDNFMDEFPGLPENPDRVLLSGQAARIDSLPEALGSSFGQQIEVYNPAQYVEVSALPDHKKEVFTTIGPEWTTALGLAVAEDQRPSDLLVFKTPAAREKDTWWNVELPSMVGLGFLFLALFVYGFQSHRVNAKLKSTEQHLQNRLSDLRKRNTTYQSRQKQATALQEQMVRLRRLRQHGLITLQALRDLPAVQPDEATISSLTLDQQSLQVDGYVPKHIPNPRDVIQSFKQKIETKTSFSVTREPRTPDKEGNQRFRFLISHPNRDDLTDAE